MSDNIEGTIEKAKKAIEENDVENAVKYDSILHKYLQTGTRNVHDKAEFHKNQYDFIFKYRLKYYAMEIVFLALGSIVTLLAFTEASTMSQILFGGAALYILYKLFKHFHRHNLGLKVTNSQEYNIIQEKINHENVLNELSKIVQYQMDTFQKMSKIYQEYEAQQTNKLGNMFGSLGDTAEEHD